MAEVEISDAIRRMLATRCCSKRTRSAIFSYNQPTDWKPGSLRDPRDPDEYFTEDSAWNFISELLNGGCEVEIVVLEKPPGKTGYVIKVAGCPPVSHIYIKLQLGAERVIGRSFHESYVQTS
ncbi:hypothetical protein EDC40_101177 [Aminobacter aminovorans]|uniref:Uncharacterized protein n=1 Tax=Aminobacter aminovorans TaxID=83263 RepID=A0A380WPD8_AMIAI|nr:hypothetical protein EDC40_101177 [Aminobacter aminovorans]SUU90711.1 Uncharacterised protein [Aminobacter aminovorans]